MANHKRASAPSSNWWTTLHGGAPRWLLVAAAVFLVVCTGFVAVSRATPSVSATSTSTFLKAPQPPVTRSFVEAYVIGDSVTAGSGTGGGPTNGYAGEICADMSWDCTIDGVASSGFVAHGEQAKLHPRSGADQSFQTRLAAVIKARPDVVIVAGGRNDQGQPPKVVGHAAHRFFNRLRSALPAADIMVIAGFRWQLSQDRRWAHDQKAIAAQLRVQARNVDANFINPYGLITIDDANASTMTGTDGWHPSAKGAADLGKAFVRILAKEGYPLGPEQWTYDFGSRSWIDTVAASVDALHSPKA